MNLSETRILNKAYSKKLRLVFDNIHHSLDNNNFKKAANIINNISIKDSDIDYELKWRFVSYFNNKLYREYFSELYNYFLKLRLILGKILLYSKESKSFNNQELYFNTLHNDLILYLEFGFTLVFAFKDKYAQFVNIYCDLKINEEFVSFYSMKSKLKEKLYLFEELKLSPTLIKKILNIDGVSINGIPIFKEAKKLRDNFVHKICEVNRNAFREKTKIEKHIKLYQESFNLCIKLFEYLNEMIISNEYRIALIRNVESINSTVLKKKKSKF